MPSPSRPAHAVRRSLTAVTAALLAGAVALATVAPVAAHDRPVLPVRVDLPDGFSPEGIESWGRWLFAGSLVDGDIWRGDAVTGEGEILVDETGLASTGLHIDRRGRLWVAGAGTDTIRVYSARTGEHLETYTFPTADFINDLDVADGAVYATDSVNQQLLVIPLGRGGALPAPSTATTMPLTGDITYQPGFNANGLATSRGWLILVQSNTGLLFRVDPATGGARAIDTGGQSVTAGDGLEIRGRTLYVVRNQLATVAVFRLSPDRLSARFVGNITADSAPGVELSVPTTATVALGGLYVVNARFGVMPAPTDFWITRLPRWP